MKIQYKIRFGLDGKAYMVFNDTFFALEVSMAFDIALHCCGAYENAVLLSDYLEASLNDIGG